MTLVLALFAFELSLFTCKMGLLFSEIPVKGEIVIPPLLLFKSGTKPESLGWEGRQLVVCLEQPPHLDTQRPARGHQCKLCLVLEPPSWLGVPTLSLSQFRLQYLPSHR